jgi:hypothetical protein
VNCVIAVFDNGMTAAKLAEKDLHKEWAAILK